MNNENQNPKEDEQLSRDRLESSIESHRQAEPETVERIGAKLPLMKQKQSQQGKIDVAGSRLDRFYAVRERRLNPKMRIWMIGAVIAVGAVIFSTGFQTVLKKLGNPLFAGGGAILGLVATFFIEDRATKALGKSRSRKDAQGAIASILQQQANHKPQTPIANAYADSQIALVRQIEKEHLVTNPDRMDLYFAMAGTAVESGVAFVVVLSSGGLLLALLSAALPVSVIWIAASFMSDRFEFVDHCEALIPAYESYLPASDHVTETEMLEVLILDADVAYLSGNGKNGYRNIDQSRFATEASFWWSRKAYFERTGLEAIRDRHQQHEQDVEDLPNKFPMPKVEMTDLSPAEQRMQERVVAGQKQDWVDAEKLKLEQKLTNDIEYLHAKYGQAVKERQAKALRAEENFRNADRSGQEIGDLNEPEAA